MVKKEGITVTDIAEQICLAVDEIVKERIKGINFDTTITAIIVDNKNASNNQYVCSNGTSQFIAYSKDTSYEINDSVQVTIPNNDYSKQKIIIGRYVAENDKPFTYVKPFSTIIDVSSNLALGVEDKKFSLLANENFDKGETFTEVHIWSKTFDEKFTDFTRLGILGQFSSWLSALKPIKGNYGYKLRILTSNGDIVVNDISYEQTEDGEKRKIDFNSTNEELLKKWSKYYTNILNDLEYDLSFKEELFDKTPNEWYEKISEKIGKTLEEIKEILKNKPNEDKDKEIHKNIAYYIIGTYGQITELELSSYDMYGDPYNFQGFFEQEQVYDISKIKNIISMALFFYQESGSFIDKDEKPIPYLSVFDYPLNNNLFTKGPYICLGYDLGNFDSEQAILYTLDDDTYLIKDGIDPVVNRKTIRLRWLHKFDNGDIKVITDNSDLKDYEIRWYRYKLGAPSSDEYSGVYWERKELPENAESAFTFILDPETNTAEEKIKAIVLYQDKIIRSNILVFTNEKGAISGATADFLAGLSIWCTDNSYGNYYLYGQNNKLTNESDANQVRTLKANFVNANIAKNFKTDESVDFLEARRIIWEFPLNNTMIIVDGFNYNYKYEKNNSSYTLPGYYNDAVVEITKENTIRITREWNEKNGKIYNLQDYRIEKTYNAISINNTVKCTIEKDDITYSATKDFSFGLIGTNGTDVTLVIDFDNNRTALNANAEKEIVSLTAHLYDYNHQEIRFEDYPEVTCTWTWKYNIGKEEIQILERDESESWPVNICRLYHEKSLDLNTGNYFQILTCTISGFGNYPLTAYKAIPIRKNAQYRNYVGPIDILYNSTGYADYYKKPCELWWCEKSDEVNAEYDMVYGNIIQNKDVIWDIYNPLEEDPLYLGTFSLENRDILKPASIYFKNSDFYGIVCKDKESNVLWIQPLVILQNQYPSGVINQWDGKTLTLNENEGYILSTAIAAGRKTKTKNDVNTFSGVMIGDLEPLETTDDFKKTGIYGLHEGRVAFAFKEDGTAFIGKSGFGRIEFNGNSGEIFSSAWKVNEDEQGLYMNLDKAILKMNRDDMDMKKHYITLSADEEEYPFSIGTEEHVFNRPFRVTWDGTAYIYNGRFKGTIYTSQIASNDGEVELVGVLKVGDGYLGEVSANIGGSELSGDGIGLYILENGMRKAIKVTKVNLGWTFNYYEKEDGTINGGFISITDNGITMGGASLSCQIPAENQKGIYARFA